MDILKIQYNLGGVSLSNYFNTNIISDQTSFNNHIYESLTKVFNINTQIIFLCIGTDRATGDSLGPLVGHKLKNINYPNVHVYGTLDNPVHAKNIQNIVDYIHNTYSNPIILAIDACLGQNDHIGYVCFGEGPIKPGAGVSKDLQPVGDLSITGIVNFSGFMDMVILQNTRLNVVMKIADFIVCGIKSSLWKLNKKTKMLS